MKAAISASTLLVVLTLCVSGCGKSQQSQSSDAPGPAAAGVTTGVDRTVLPIPEPDYPRATELDARNARPHRFEVKARKGAPNVVVVLIDDIGFGHPAASAVRYPCRRWSGWPNTDSNTTAFTPRAVLADAHSAAHRPQPPLEQRRRDHGSRHRISGQYRRTSAERHAARQNPAAKRLQHVGVRQVSRDGAMGSERLGAVRSLAYAFGVRQVLRLHRR